MCRRAEGLNMHLPKRKRKTSSCPWTRALSTLPLQGDGFAEAAVSKCAETSPQQIATRSDRERRGGSGLSTSAVKSKYTVLPES